MESESQEDVQSSEIEQPAYHTADTPTFLTNGLSYKLSVPEFNPLVKAEIAPPDATEEETEALAALRSKRTLTEIERAKIEEYVRKRVSQIEEGRLAFEKELHAQAVVNSEKKEELKKRERALEKSFKELEKKDKTLAEREKIINERDKFIKEMPDVMDEIGTRKWLNDQRKFTLATYRSMAEHSTSERTRMQALQRLSDEDRGQHGKGLREDPDSGPGYFILKPGEIGIPA
jgi:hypothetical protein